MTVAGDGHNHRISGKWKVVSSISGGFSSAILNDQYNKENTSNLLSRMLTSQVTLLCAQFENHKIEVSSFLMEKRLKVIFKF